MTRKPMNSVPDTLRPVDELITLHEVECDQREIIAEGRTDASVIEWFLKVHELEVPVYARKDRISVPDSYVTKLGLPLGERGYLIAASTLVDQSPRASEAITFVIDGDYDYTINPPIPSGKSLLVTDYSCLESYCLDRSVIGKFLTAMLRAPSDVAPGSVIDGIVDALADLFAVRWVLQNLQDPRKIISKIVKRCSINGATIALDKVALLRDTIQASDDIELKSLTAAELADRLIELKSILKDFEPRYCLNGHDLPEMLSYFIEKRYPQILGDDRKLFKHPDTVHIALLGCLEAAFLGKTPLFSEIIRRVQSAQSGLTRL
jgi:hypothetical protein